MKNVPNVLQKTKTTETQRQNMIDQHGVDLTCEQWDQVLEFIKTQPARARAFADGQPISDSDVAIAPGDEEALNQAARGVGDNE